MTKRDSSQSFDTSILRAIGFANACRKKGDIEVKWVPTAVMPADGLTKVLPRQQFERSVELLGMRDIAQIIGQE
jgi:hypothetical protein